MRTFVLIPGAGGDPWYWHRVVSLLQEVGHDAVAVDRPGNDQTAGLRCCATVTILSGHRHRRWTQLEQWHCRRER